MGSINSANLQDDWAASEDIIKKWLKRARESQFSHFEAAKYFARWNYLIGVPTVVLASCVGTTVFATLQKQVSLGIQIVVGGISVLAAVLASLQTFLRLGERAEKHRGVAAHYGAVRRNIEQTLALPTSARGPLPDVMTELRKQLDTLAETAPDVPQRVWNDVKAQFQTNPPSTIGSR